MQTKISIILISSVLSIQVMAQTNELKCFVSSKSGEEIQLPQNEMKTPNEFPHLKGQSFEKIVILKNGGTANFNFTLRSKFGKNFDFRISSSSSLYITAALDERDMFQYTNDEDGIAVQCTKDY